MLEDESQVPLNHFGLTGTNIRTADGLRAALPSDDELSYTRTNWGDGCVEVFKSDPYGRQLPVIPMEHHLVPNAPITLQWVKGIIDQVDTITEPPPLPPGNKLDLYTNPVTPADPNFVVSMDPTNPAPETFRHQMPQKAIDIHFPPPDESALFPAECPKRVVNNASVVPLHPALPTTNRA